MLDLLIRHTLDGLLANLPDFQKTPPPLLCLVAIGGVIWGKFMYYANKK